MEFSTSATQRSSSSEPLTIQPGSVRSPAMDAANDFARHLAENAQQRSERRDDRPVDRRERSTSSERAEKRKDEPSARETGRKEREEDETRATARSEEEAAKIAKEELALPGSASTEEGTSSDEVAIPAEAEEATESSASPEAENESTEDATEDGTDLPLAAAVPTTDTSKAQATGKTDAVTAAATKQAGDAAALQQAGTSANAASAEQGAGTTTPDGEVAKAAAGNEDAQTRKQTQARAAAQLPNQPSAANSAAEELAAAGIEEQQIKAPKTGKGLGQEAAEKLAEKKSGDKQAFTQPNAAAAANTQQAARHAVTPQPAQPGVASTATTAAPASGDLAISSVQQAASGGNAATVRIGTLPGQSQPTQLPANTIALQMARNLQKGANRFDIRLDPPEMGRIDVRMEVRKDGHVVAHMTVDRPETLDLLQRDARALQQALNNAGLQADSDSLNFSLRDQNADGGSRDFAGSAGGDRVSSDDQGTEMPVGPTYNINLAANGGVDIRV